MCALHLDAHTSTRTRHHNDASVGMGLMEIGQAIMVCIYAYV